MNKKIYLQPKFEFNLISKSPYRRVIGIDEVGRGCWAGPTAVGFYEITENSTHVDNVIDSKMLPIKTRISTYNKLISTDLISKSSVVFGDVILIDSMGIGKAIEKIISDFVALNDDGQTYFLIDGQFTADFGKNSQKVIRGDSTYYSIAAASILAKVERDRFMEQISLEYPSYGFDKHKGYGTKQHIQALEQFGTTAIHRKSYKPIQRYL